MESTINNGMCRCCASEGTFKDVKSSYHWMGEEEIYSDMLRECFDVSLLLSEDGNDGGICEVCITQLRNAANFKKQVQHTEEQFKLRLDGKLYKSDSIVKIEPSRGEDDDNDSDNMSGDDFSGAEYEVPIKTEKLEETKPKKRPATSKPSTSRAKKTKNAEPETSTKRMEERDILDNSKLKPSRDTYKMRMEKEKHHANITEILKWTNATPIRGNEDGIYTCSFCDEQNQKPADLKVHTLNSHSDNDIRKASFMTKSMDLYHVKLDITKLCCNICEEAIDTIENLIGHLKYEHGKPLYTDINNRIVPFKFDTNSLTCFMCSNVFYQFRTLLGHMNKHYRNFVCNVCDAGFVTRAMARMHSKRHVMGSHKCEYCDKVFNSFPSKRSHERNAHTHRQTLYKCAHCSETFMYFQYKQNHLREVHGVDFSAKCQACDKVFRDQKKLRIHMRRDHLLERRYKCTQCDMKFFKSNELNDHMVKHTGSRTFECELCHKMFGLKKTLLSHMRSHLRKAAARTKD